MDVPFIMGKCVVHDILLQLTLTNSPSTNCKQSKYPIMELFVRLVSEHRDDISKNVCKCWWWSQFLRNFLSAHACSWNDIRRRRDVKLLSVLGTWLQNSAEHRLRQTGCTTWELTFSFGMKIYTLMSCIPRNLAMKRYLNTLRKFNTAFYT